MYETFYTTKSYGRNLSGLKKPSGSKSAFLSTNYDSFPKNGQNPFPSKKSFDSAGGMHQTIEFYIIQLEKEKRYNFLLPLDHTKHFCWRNAIHATFHYQKIIKISENRKKIDTDGQHAKLSTKYQDLKSKYETHRNKLVTEIENLRSQGTVVSGEVKKLSTQYNSVKGQNASLMKSIDKLRLENASSFSATRKISTQKAQLQKTSEIHAGQSAVAYQGYESNITKLLEKVARGSRSKIKFLKKLERLKSRSTQITTRNPHNPKFGLENLTVKLDRIDTKTLLKNRLKKIILNNKEKFHLQEKYQNSMESLTETFNHYSKADVSSTIDEISRNFVKSEEQNKSLFGY